MNNRVLVIQNFCKRNIQHYRFLVSIFGTHCKIIVLIILKNYDALLWSFLERLRKILLFPDKRSIFVNFMFFGPNPLILRQFPLMSKLILFF